MTPSEPTAPNGNAEEVPAAPPFLRAYLATLGTIALVLFYGIEAGALIILTGPGGVDAPLDAAPSGWPYVAAEVTLILVIVGAERLLGRIAHRLHSGGMP